MPLTDVAQDMLNRTNKPHSYPVTVTLQRGLILRLENDGQHNSLCIARHNARPSEHEILLVIRAFKIPPDANGALTLTWARSPQLLLVPETACNEVQP